MYRKEPTLSLYVSAMAYFSQAFSSTVQQAQNGVAAAAVTAIAQD